MAAETEGHGCRGSRARAVVFYDDGGQDGCGAVIGAASQRNAACARIEPDEYTAGVNRAPNPRGRASEDVSGWKYLEEINRQDGITVICNLHFLSLARRYATRVIALKAGQIVFDGLPAEIDEDRFRAIYGEDAVEVEIR